MNISEQFYNTLNWKGSDLCREDIKNRQKRKLKMILNDDSEVERLLNLFDSVKNDYSFCYEMAIYDMIAKLVLDDGVNSKDIKSLETLDVAVFAVENRLYIKPDLESYLVKAFQNIDKAISDIRNILISVFEAAGIKDSSKKKVQVWEKSRRVCIPKQNIKKKSLWVLYFPKQLPKVKNIIFYRVQRRG